MKKNKNSLYKDRIFIIEDWVNNDTDIRLCLRTKKWKYIIDRKCRELYDLENDPREQKNCVLDKSNFTIKFEKILQDHAKTYLQKEKKKIKSNIQRLKVANKI